jgi:hypothetical protein
MRVHNSGVGCNRYMNVPLDETTLSRKISISRIYAQISKAAFSRQLTFDPYSFPIQSLCGNVPNLLTCDSSLVTIIGFMLSLPCKSVNQHDFCCEIQPKHYLRDKGQPNRLPLYISCIYVGSCLKLSF